MSKICVSIGRTRQSAVKDVHQELANKGAELVEYRLDWLKQTVDVGKLIADRPTPVIATCRRRKGECGKFLGPEEERFAILRQAIIGGVDYIDIEEDIAKKIPRYGNTKRVISYHNFRETPDDLDAIYKHLKELDADVVKIATMANQPSDAVRMLQLVDNADLPTVAFCMGEPGVFSRILCGRYGSPWTYSTFSDERVLAPGQLTFSEMKDVYRYPNVTRETKVFGVIGDPIAQSASPQIHNAAFAEHQLDAVYVPFLIPADSYGSSMKSLDWLGVDGFSVTIPHKLAAAKSARFRDEFVENSGAANTLYRDDRRRWHASNTDLPAALSTLRDALPNGENLSGKSVLILGCGGVSRAIALGLIKVGAAVTVTNRTKATGQALAKNLGCKFIPWENRATVLADIVVNGTKLGMFPNVDETPMQDNWLREGTVVFDTVYNPENTLLLKDARGRDCHTASGLEMFVRQAADQYEAFVKQPAPIETMRQALRRHISPVELN